MLRFVLALALFAMPCATQRIIVVDGDYNSLTVAIAGAQPGDILLVRAGQYRPPTINKGLTILCDPGVSLIDVFGTPTIVRGIPASQRLVIRGAGFAIGHNPVNVFIQDCAGAVILEECSNQRHLRITNCSRVAFNRCRLNELQISSSTAVVTEGSCSGTLTHGLTIERSDVVVNSAVVESVWFFANGPAIQLTSGSLTLTGAGTHISSGGTTAPAITTTAGNIRLDPAVAFTGSTPIVGGARVIQQSIPAARGDGVPPGQTFNGSTYGAPGDLTYTFVSVPIAPASTPFGTLWVDPSSPFVDAGVIPAGGIRSYSSPIPPLPLPGVALTLQPIAITPSLEVRVGEPVTVVLD